MKKVLFLSVLLLIVFPFVSSLNFEEPIYGISEDSPDIDFGGNYSINVNYSEYSGDAHLFDGYSSSGLYTYWRGLYETYFDGIYAKLTDLTSYVPYTGATSDVDLGAYDISATNGNFSGTLNVDGLSTFGDDVDLGSSRLSFGTYGYIEGTSIGGGTENDLKFYAPDYLYFQAGYTVSFKGTNTLFDSRMVFKDKTKAIWWQDGNNYIDPDDGVFSFGLYNGQYEWIDTNGDTTLMYLDNDGDLDVTNDISVGGDITGFNFIVAGFLGGYLGNPVYMGSDIDMGGYSILDSLDSYVDIPYLQTDYIQSDNTNIDINGVYIEGSTSVFTDGIYSSLNTNNRILYDYLGNEVLNWNEDDIEIKTNLSVDGASYLGDGGGTNYTEIKDDGEINLHGTARVKKRLQINVGSIKGAGANPASYVDYGLNGAFEFSKVIDESIAEASAVPFDIDRSVAPTFTIGWSSPETTGTCVWQLEVLYREEDEDWSSTTPQSTIEVEASPSNTTDGLAFTSFTLPTLSSTDAGMIFRLSRLGSDADDDMDDVAYVFGGAIDYTANKLGAPL